MTLGTIKGISAVRNLYKRYIFETSSYATCFTAGGAIRIAHYDVIDDVISS